MARNRKWAFYRTSDGVVVDVVVTPQEPTPGAGEAVEDISTLAIGEGWTRTGPLQYNAPDGTPQDEYFGSPEFVNPLDVRYLFTLAEQRAWDKMAFPGTADFDELALLAEKDLDAAFQSGGLHLNDGNFQSYVQLRENLGNITSTRKVEVLRGVKKRGS